MDIERLPKGQKIEDVLPHGDIDACMLPEITQARQHTRLPECAASGRTFAKSKKNIICARKIFPIRHVVVVKNSILERHPWAARSLVDAFTKAKEIGIKHVSDTRRSFLAWYGAEVEEERELFGDDAWPYNIKDNRVVLETMARYAEIGCGTDEQLIAVKEHWS